jgi:hypothetical protein
LLVVGCWLLVVGCWLLVVGYLSQETERHAERSKAEPKHLACSSNSFSGTTSFNEAGEMLRQAQHDNC